MPTPVTLPAELPPVPAPAWERTYPGTPSQARHVRAALRSLLHGCPAADDIVLVVSELAANAIAHSDSGRPGGTFTVRVRPGGGHIRAEVEDQGSDWDGDLAASARRLHGLSLVAALGRVGDRGRTRPLPARVGPRQLPGPGLVT